MCVGVFWVCFWWFYKLCLDPCISRFRHRFMSMSSMLYIYVLYAIMFPPHFSCDTPATRLDFLAICGGRVYTTELVNAASEQVSGEGEGTSSERVDIEPENPIRETTTWH